MLFSRIDDLTQIVHNALEAYRRRIINAEEMKVVTEAVSPIKRLLQDCRRYSVMTHADMELEAQYYRKY